MMCYLFCNVHTDGSLPTRIFGNNLIVILNSQNPAYDISKKHVAISFHVVREAVTAGIIEPYWPRGDVNTYDIMIEKIHCTDFKRHTDYIYW